MEFDVTTSTHTLVPNESGKTYTLYRCPGRYTHAIVELTYIDDARLGDKDGKILVVDGKNNNIKSNITNMSKVVIAAEDIIRFIPGTNKNKVNVRVTAYEEKNENVARVGKTNSLEGDGLLYVLESPSASSANLLVSVEPRFIEQKLPEKDTVLPPLKKDFIRVFLVRGDRVDNRHYLPLVNSTFEKVEGFKTELKVMPGDRIEVETVTDIGKIRTSAFVIEIK